MNTIQSIAKIIDFVFPDKKSNKEIQEHVSKKTNEFFNDKLNNSKDTSFCDAVRKNKQKQIEELKK